MENIQYICYRPESSRTWVVSEQFMGSTTPKLVGLTEWQARAICAILNKGR